MQWQNSGDDKVLVKTSISNLIAGDIFYHRSEDEKFMLVEFAENFTNRTMPPEGYCAYCFENHQVALYSTDDCEVRVKAKVQYIYDLYPGQAFKLLNDNRYTYIYLENDMGDEEKFFYFNTSNNLLYWTEKDILQVIPVTISPETMS